MEANTMTQSRVEKTIWQEIRKRDITFYDMIGVSNYVDDSNDKNITGIQDTRRNRFKQTMGSERLKEILCLGEKKQFDDYPPFKVPLQDLFEFWWDKCIDRHAFVDEILEDIYDHFTEQMRPTVKETETMDMYLNFEEALQPEITDLHKERVKRSGCG
jgi:hypothetical protein